MTLERPWPKPLAEIAYHGMAGDIVKAIEPETEADPAAVLLQLLTMFGNAINRSPHFRVGADVHHLNLFVAVVADTSKGRKGMSRGRAQQIFDAVDPDWVRDCVTSGLSSGEGLIWSIRDPLTKKVARREKGRIVAYDDVVEDHGIEDKRLLVIESEFASTLKVMQRDGNTLSPLLRLAWDGQDLRTLTKNSSARATSPHISVVAHITAEELRRHLELTEYANGFGNRFLWVLAKRSKELPHGGQPVDFRSSSRDLAHAIDLARRKGELHRDDAADRLWETVYGRLSAGRPGLLGAVTARAEAQVMRLACLYSLLDAEPHITETHVTAGLELWRYCFQSAAYLFGDRLGDIVADTILNRLKQVWPANLTRTEISLLFHRNQSATAIDRALAQLKDLHLADVEKDASSSGRPVERWFYIGNEINEINEKRPEGGEDISFNSFISSPQKRSSDDWTRHFIHPS
jgi:hypothetical protein